ncbi:MAG: sigma-70 family RNA polymerase sigma factor [Ardenticatenales bacterium]|nr:sigma-70 family RNA polymerase sigma factor [Ardenticatenales bacterium]
MSEAGPSGFWKGYRAGTGVVEPVSDGSLVRSVLEGDEVALGTLYGNYVDAIYRFILAQVRDREDAEDLTADTFARMIQGLAGFRHEASFKNWLYQIARNAVRNHRRAAGYRRTVALTPQLHAADHSDAPTDGVEEDAVVVGLLQPLPPRYRQVLELRFLAGLSIEETAKRMEITVANAKVLQHRALKRAAGLKEASEVHARRRA